MPEYTGTPARWATSRVARSFTSDSAMDMFTLARLWLSLADTTVWISSTRASTARTAPLSFGTSAEKRVPGLRWMRAMTSSASRSAGMALGDTKDVTSMRGTPVAESRSTTSTLRSVGIQSGSIWNPSRVPTSQSVTRCGSFMRAPPGLPSRPARSPRSRHRAIVRR